MLFITLTLIALILKAIGIISSDCTRDMNTPIRFLRVL